MGSRHLLEPLNKTEKGIPEEVMHKNRLQEYTQKSGQPLPDYQIVNEGFVHAPKFRSTVLVNGKKFKSRLTYPHRKEAEQDAAELALKSIYDDIKNEECTILPDLMYCKSILNEYAVKRNLESPQYTTTQAGKLRPVFVSTLAFSGKSYASQVGKSKKEAEQLAAFATVQSLLESSLCGNLHQIIKSKIKISRKLHQANHSARSQCHFSLTVEPGSSKKVIDTPCPTVSICGWDPTVNPVDKNKRKLDSVNLGSKKLPREDGLKVVSTALEKTKGKGNDAIYMLGSLEKNYSRKKETKFQC